MGGDPEEERMTRSRGLESLLLLLALGGLSSGCRKPPPGGRPLAVRVWPEEKIGQPPEVLVSFDHPMVRAERMGQPDASAPLRLDPPVAGTLRWRTDRQLAFTPSAPLPRSTRFFARVPSGTRSLDGFVLAEDRRWSFATERLTGEAVPDSSVHALPAARWAMPDQAVRLTFNQPVRAADVQRHCVYAAAGEIAARVEPTPASEGSAGGALRFRVRPERALPGGADVTFRCAPDLTGAEGPLGMEKPIAAAFHTFGAFAVAKVAPEGSQVDIDGTSLTIHFTNPIADGPLPIALAPPVAGFPERAGRSLATVDYGCDELQPNTEYKITIGAGLKDVFGQALPGEHVATFRTGDASPRADLQTGVKVVESARGGYPIWTRNLHHLEVTTARVPEAKLAALLGAVTWWDDDPVDLAALGLAGNARTLPVDGPQNRWHLVELAPPGVKPGATLTGIYYFAVKADEAPLPERKTKPQTQEAIVNFTDLGATVKLSAASGIVWVTALSTGAPVAGAQVTVRGRGGAVLFHGRTDGDGVALLPGRAALEKRRPAPKEPALRPEPGEEPEGDEGEFAGEGEGGDANRLLVVVRDGDDVTWVDPGRPGGLAAWNFDLSVDNSPSPDRLRGFLHSDRGLYRPGDTVHLRGLARILRLEQGLHLPREKAIAVAVRDPRGQEAVSKKVRLSRFGGFALDVPLGEEARLGDWSVEARLPEGSFRETFSVEEYRTAAFHVQLGADKPHAEIGDDLHLSVEARYFYGSPVRGAPVAWRVHTRPRTPSFEAWREFEFGDARQWDSFYDRSSEAHAFLTEEEAKLDGEGRARLALPLPPERLNADVDLLVEGEVRDETNQTLAGQLAVPVSRAGLHLGLALGAFLGEAGKPQRVRLRAVTPDGKAAAARATVRLVRRNWSCAWESFGYAGSYRCDRKENEVAVQQVEVRAEAPAVAELTPTEPGDYLVIAEAKDARGRATASSRWLWVWGGGDAGWQASDGARFKIVADKPSYRAGDTARLLLQAPLGEATGLLTVERDGLLERRLIHFAPGATTVELPIRDGFAPNVYASVVLVAGRSGAGPRGLPQMKMGMVNLPVDTAAHRLAVTVATDRASYRPGDPVEATVEVKDSAGRPVQAEVALSAADEGVLSLIAFKTPDPMATFYEPWGLGVQTASQYERIAHLPEPGAQRYATGGDGAGRPGTMRSRFLATAYWNPAVQTDAAGRATVRFAAPDNLTAYRLMAVAADAGDRFGSGERAFTVRKPLQLLAALPRFVTAGDTLRAGVVVVNETGAAGTAVVAADPSGLAITGDRRRSVAVAAGARVPVLFSLRAEKEGHARMRFTAALGAEQDGLELALPVNDPAPWETEPVAVGRTDGTFTARVALPEGARAEGATLEVSLDPHGLAGIEEGLRALIEYPYGCLEQTTSRVVPLVAVEELSRSLGLHDLDGPRLRGFLRAGLAKIMRFQNDDGGFSLWVGGHSEMYLTAFALWGLSIARDAGHAVDAARMEAGIAYLRRRLGDDRKDEAVHDELGEQGSRAFAVHVLALLGHPEPGHTARLAEAADTLPRFGQAFLARALAATAGRDAPGVKALLDKLLTSARRGSDGLLIPESEGPRLAWYMSSDVRTSAIATDALLDLRPEEPRLPDLVRGLLAERSRDGAWPTTQDNLYTLVALTRYAKAQRPSTVKATAEVGGKTIVDARGGFASGLLRRGSVPLARALAAGEVVIRADGGPVHYAVHARFRRDRAALVERHAGIAVRREILDAQSGAPIDHAALNQVVRVRVTASADGWPPHVAIVDRLPAGLEALNTRFVTTGSGGAEDEHRNEYWIDARELRDDRVAVFADELWYLDHGFEYLARATTVGTFVQPPAVAEAMYQPGVGGRTTVGTFVVGDK
jgi:uncharacterized protein YfaS (alpha-2-macroglobulin family)